MEKKEIVIDPKSGDVTEQIQKIVEQNNNVQPMNRAQRRAMAKKNKKKEKQLQRYLINHPEAMKIEWDEEAVRKVEEEEKKSTIEVNSSIVDGAEVIDVPFTEVGEIMDEDKLEIEKNN